MTLFDTGRLRPGGRCASRLTKDEPAAVKNRSSGVMEVRRACDEVASDTTAKDTSGKEVAENIAAILKQQFTNPNNSRDRIIAMGPVDHAAQILSIPENVVGDADGSCFRNQVDKWLKEGVIQPFPDNSVCELVAAKDDGTTTSSSSIDSAKPKLYPIQGEMYYGKGGMSSIPLAMRDYCTSCNRDENNPHSFQIMQDVWVSPSNGVKYIGNPDSNEHQWELRAGSKSLGKYHRLVIAHNGKCADRIMSKTPARAFHSLLRTKFAPTVPQWGGKEMTLNSIYSLVFAIKTDNKWNGAELLTSSMSTPSDIYTVMIRNEPNLRLLSSNTLKHSHAQNPSSSTTIEVYTLLSSPQFGKQYKGPQENLPLDLMEKVTMKMLTSLEKALHVPKGRIVDNVVDLKLQLWGAAVPLNTWTSGGDEKCDGFVYDSQYNVGACGDWILDPSIAGAWESGRRLASWIARGEEKSVGLPRLDVQGDGGGKFVPSRAALESGIGTIPSTPNAKFEFSTNNGGSGGGRGSSGSYRSGRGGRGGRNNSGRGRGGRGNNNRNRDEKRSQTVLP